MSAGEESETYDRKAKKNLAFLCALIDTNFNWKYKSTVMKNILKNDRLCLNTLIPETEEHTSGGMTLLHLAMERNDKESFDFFLEQGVDFTLTNTMGETVVHQSLRKNINNFKQFHQLCGKLNNPYTESVLSRHVKTGKSINPCDVNGLTHFHVACMLNHVESTNFFLKNGVLVNMTINREASYLSGYSPLHLAVRYCAYEVAELLLRHGANVHAKDTKGVSALHLLVEQSVKTVDSSKIDWSIVKPDKLYEIELCSYQRISASFIDHLMHDDSFIADDYGFNCLHLACTLSDDGMVKHFLQLGYSMENAVNVDSPICPGYTALHFAAHFNKHTLILLIQQGGKVSKRDAAGWTPFEICMQKNDVSKYLYALINSESRWKDVLFNDGKTKLSEFVFALRSKRQLLKFLHNANINMRLNEESPLWSGFTLLHLLVTITARRFKAHDIHECRHYVMRYYLQTYHCWSDAFKLCNDLGADFNVQDSRGRSPLHLAFYHGDFKLVKTVLGYQDKDSNLVDDKGLSHLHIACIAGKVNVVTRMLKSEQVDVNHATTATTLASIGNSFIFAKGSTSLHLTIIMGNFDLAQKLLEHGADVAIQDDDHLTPLHRLFDLDKMHSDITEVYKLLSVILSFENNIALPVTDCGLTYLHVASYWNYLPAIEKLLDLGENINSVITCKLQESCLDSLFFLEPYDGSTPLHIAIEEHDNKIVEILVRRGANILAEKDGTPILYKVLECKYSTAKIKTLFATVLQSNNVLQNRVLKDSGLTMLHVACAMTDVALVRRLCYQGINVNARLSTSSTLWPGSTPLHVLIMMSENDISEVGAIVDLLLHCGSDVTITNSNGKTSIHEVFDRFSVSGPVFSRVLLRAQKDFSVNPVSNVGMSHFHIACLCKDVVSVKKFINHGANVNLPISHCHTIFGNLTPLHLALYNTIFVRSYLLDHYYLTSMKYLIKNLNRIDSNCFVGTVTVPNSNAIDCLLMVNLLLENGANPNTTDGEGNTSLHTALMYKNPQVLICNSLIRYGAKMNEENFISVTPLEYLLSMAKKSNIGLVEFLVRRGCKINSYNSINKEGLVAKILSKNRQGKQAIAKCLCMAIARIGDDHLFDEKNRSLIHNLVSHYGDTITFDDYIKLFDVFAQLYPDVNHEDSEGNTPLHMAIDFQNWAAVIGLLNSGADINLLKEEDSAVSILNQELERNWASNAYLFKYISKHIYKLNLRGIHVNSVNQRLDKSIRLKFQLDYNDCLQQFLAEIEILENFEIQSDKTVFHNFLSETGIVVSYNNLPQTQQNTIDYYFKQNCEKLRKRFPHFISIIKLQYSKALKRKPLIESARMALSLLLQMEIPYLCSETVLRFLSNADLDNLNLSVDL